MAFSGTVFPRRYETSAVTTISAPASSMRPRSAPTLNPAYTTECTAPSRAHASMVATPSIVAGI